MRYLSHLKLQIIQLYIEKVRFVNQGGPFLFAIRPGLGSAQVATRH